AASVPASGAIVVDHYTFGSSPAAVAGGTNKILYQYVLPGDAFLNPALAVDANVASFTDPQTGAVQADPFAGNIYISWTTVNQAPAGNPPNFNPARIPLVVSSDGGQTFSGAALL